MNVVRPSKLRAMIGGARFERALVYNGKKVTPFTFAQ